MIRGGTVARIRGGNCSKNKGRNCSKEESTNLQSCKCEDVSYKQRKTKVHVNRVPDTPGGDTKQYNHQVLYLDFAKIIGLDI